MPIGPARMPLMDHLGELRRRLTIIFVSLFIAAAVMYVGTPAIIEILKMPIASYLPKGEELAVLTALGGFSLRFKVAMYAAVVICAPLILWQFLAFFLPALKPNERKWVVPTIFVGTFLFVVGIVFCYFIILDPAFNWLTSQSAAIGQIVPDAENYIRIILLFEIAFGIAFELPMVIFYLIVFNIVPYRFFRENWRVVYIVLMLICAMVTPDASPVTMFFMFAAMVVLYEVSLLLSRLVLAKRIQKQKQEESLELAPTETE
ncbi:MAG: twin-arginine translocase subunit TatC [Coriobacteriia bacterium]|nr:twin-arginine translocase subunit TatC [Coriobacteriia bacterium]